MNNLLTGDELKNKLLTDIKVANEVVIISAYITSPAIDWMKSIIDTDPDIKVKVVARVSPKDIAAGSTDLNALRECLSKNWDVYALSNLHAKIYLIDTNKLYVGSSNFTSNGLKIYGEGNLEAMVEIVPGAKDLDFVDNIINSAIVLNMDILEAMESYIQKNQDKSTSELTLTWPEEILPILSELWVTDFPLSNPFESPEDINYGPVFTKEFYDNHEIDLRNALKQTKAYSWLYSAVKETPEKEVYFGYLTKLLHDSLLDDPGPYRKDVKELLANLLSFCEKSSIDDISIDRPNYSQRIRINK